MPETSPTLRLSGWIFFFFFWSGNRGVGLRMGASGSGNGGGGGGSGDVERSTKGVQEKEEYLTR